MTSREPSKPYLSFVVVSRNDNHGVDLLRRMQIFVTSLLEQCKRYHLNSELIIVEWNPPEDRPCLQEALQWPKEPGPCRVRIIEVPSYIHQRYKHAKGLPLFQMIGKNVGVRRARGQFVLATNIDIIFSNELIAFLAEKKLRASYMYRVDRYDVPAEIPIYSSVDDVLMFCQQNVIRVSVRGAVVPITGQEPATLYSDPRLSVAHKLAPWLPTVHQLKSVYRPSMLLKAFLHGTRMCGYGLLWPVRKWLRIRKRIKDTGYWRPLHTNACGDFTLLHREAWKDLRAYPEWDMYSLHIDSVLCYQAVLRGKKEVVLRGAMKTFHLEHQDGWYPTHFRVLLQEKLALRGVPVLSSDDLWAFTRQLRSNKNLCFNDENWGLAGNELLESEIDVGQE